MFTDSPDFHIWRDFFGFVEPKSYKSYTSLDLISISSCLYHMAMTQPSLQIYEDIREDIALIHCTDRLDCDIHCYRSLKYDKRSP